MISVHNWTEGNDRSSDGRIIENNWANCGFEKLASSALRGRNMSMWREERWTEEKPDLNDNEQNTRLHFASTPEESSAYLNNQLVHVSMSHAWERMSTFWSLHPQPQQLFSSLRGSHPGPSLKSLSSTEEVYLFRATVLESLHVIICVKSALGMCESESDREIVHTWSTFTCRFDLTTLKVPNIKSHL